VGKSLAPESGIFVKFETGTWTSVVKDWIAGKTLASPLLLGVDGELASDARIEVCRNEPRGPEFVSTVDPVLGDDVARPWA
jgi:hypothetical protein